MFIASKLLQIGMFGGGVPFTASYQQHEYAADCSVKAFLRFGVPLGNL